MLFLLGVGRRGVGQRGVGQQAVCAKQVM